MESKVLVIGDAHVTDKQDLSRFKILSRFIIDKRPNVIVSIGDFMSMDCLSAWDSNKKRLMEGRRFANEVEAGNKALDLLDSELKAYNIRQHKAKKPTYKPYKVFVFGNHENRVDRYLDENPVFETEIDLVPNLRLTERHWHKVDYKENYTYMGVNFTHVPINRAGTPVSGKLAEDKALQLYNTSVVYGHTHCLRTRADFRHGMTTLNQALNVGCFFEHEEPYTRGQPHDFWRGVIMLNMFGNNEFDIETYSIKRLRKIYDK